MSVVVRLLAQTRLIPNTFGFTIAKPRLRLAGPVLIIRINVLPRYQHWKLVGTDDYFPLRAIVTSPRTNLPAKPFRDLLNQRLLGASDPKPIQLLRNHDRITVFILIGSSYPASHTDSSDRGMPTLSIDDWH